MGFRTDLADRGGIPALPSDLSAEVERFVGDRRVQIDRWFFAARMVVGLGLAGYMIVDAMGGLRHFSEAIALTGVYLLLNAAYLNLPASRRGAARWPFALTDVAFVIVLRHVFMFEALVDPNATMVGFFSLILIAYAIYADSNLSRVLALFTLGSMGITLAMDILREPAMLDVNPADCHDPSCHSGIVVYRSYPLRGVLIMGYLATLCAVTYLLSFRLRQHVLSYAVELHRRMHIAVTNSVERSRVEKLEELNRLKRDFISVLSHELRTPLTPLRSSLELIRRSPSRDAESDELLSIALDSSEKLQRLVLDYTRLAELFTSDHDTVQRWNLRLRELVELLSRESDRCELDASEIDDVTVSADPRMLAGALTALIRRARLVSSSAPVMLRGFEDSSRVMITVRDHDSYVERSVAEMLDDPFGLSGERTFVTPSTGLELVLARYSLRRFGGMLTVESDESSGTTVYCSVPGRQAGVPSLSGPQLRFEVEHIVASPVDLRSAW